MYKVLNGVEAWDGLTDEQKVTAEIKVGYDWRRPRGSGGLFVRLGGYDLHKYMLVKEGCEFRIPEPQEWIIERVETGLCTVNHGTIPLIAELLRDFPVGTKFKLTVMEESK